MKKRAREEMVPIPQIYSQRIVKVRVNNSDVEYGTLFRLLQSFDSSSHSKRAKNYPKLPKIINKLTTPNEWKLDPHSGHLGYLRSGSKFSLEGFEQVHSPT